MPQKKNRLNFRIYTIGLLSTLLAQAAMAIGISPTVLLFQKDVPGRAELHINGDKLHSTAVNMFLLERLPGPGGESWGPYDGEAINIHPPQLIIEEGGTATASIEWNGLPVGGESLSFYLVIETLPINLEEKNTGEEDRLLLLTRIHAPIHIGLPEKNRKIEITHRYNQAEKCLDIRNTGNSYVLLNGLRLDAVSSAESKAVEINGRDIATQIYSDALIPGSRYCVDTGD